MQFWWLIPIVLFGGVLLLCNSVKFRLKDMWTAFLAIALICGFAQLVNAGVIYGDIDYKDTLVILKIMDGRIFEYIVSPEKLTVAGKVIGCICIFLAVCGSVVLYYWGNNKIYAKKARCAQNKNKEVSCASLGIVPLISYAVKKSGKSSVNKTENIADADKGGEDKDNADESTEDRENK